MKMKADIGERIKSLRKAKGLTVAALGAKTGYSPSAISKMENGQLALTYDKLMNLGAALGTDIGGLLADVLPVVSRAVGRRSISRKGEGQIVETAPYTYRYVSPELSRKQLTPNISRLHARRIEDFGPLLRHEGEEWIYVLSGEIEVHTEFYEPARLVAGDSVYIDSRMGHAYLTVSEQEAEIISVCTVGFDEGLTPRIVPKG